MAHADRADLRVEVVHCPRSGRCDRVSLQLKVGDTVGDAVRASGLCARHALDEATLRVGVWGRLQPLDMALREHDRVELYRGLQVDPKEARRLRYKRGRRTAAP
jgi:uncharacterized protein